ncbi:hypothetical protein [Rhizobium favelukesii]|uniref:Uncharacterized protein n=1 Tax=Rhizobium favelukesii TaxID=348824 RepID=W6RLR7_9HYPH|nr:hypothetical protein [Rhizobium favelukesii]MCS0463590.1 hypothetical protein [Rhizobium favelukesii]CDM59888.1 hypothetical protein LPU83_pLPU83a_0047 [Rhizobium favelukesii]
MKAYSEDLLQELDRELSDVHPEANDLLYYFLDARSTLSPTELEVILTAAGISADQQGEVIDFLLYYGVLGIRSGGGDYFIYAVNYDLKILKIRAGRDKSRYQPGILAGVEYRAGRLTIVGCQPGPCNIIGDLRD